MRVLILFWFVLAGVCHAQQPVFQNITDENGLPSAEVYSIFEDHEGFLWFMTDNGVVRYDGGEFRVFGKQEGLADPVAFEMTEDSRHRLWVRGFNGYFSVAENGRFSPYPYNFQGAQLNGKDVVRSFMVKDDGTLLFANGTGLVASIDSAGRVDAYRVDPGLLFYKPVIGEKGLIGARGVPSHLHHFQTGSDIFPIEPGSALENNGTLCYRWWHHKLYVSMDHSLFQYDHGAFRKVLYADKPIISLSVDRDDIFWVGTFNGGVLKFVDQRFTEPGRIEMLSNSTVTSVHLDREGGYWFSTLDKGLFYYPNIHLLTVELPEESKLNVVAKSNDLLYCGYYNGKLISIDKFGHQKLLATLVGPVTALMGQNGRIWASTGAMTYLLDEKGKEINRHESVRGIKKFVERNGVILGVNYSGLNRFSKEGELLGVHPLKFWTRNVLITDEDVFFAGVTGLFRMDHNLHEIDTIPELKNGKITNLIETSEGYVLATTMGDGLVVIKGDSTWSFNRHNFFPTNDILSINIRGDELWLGTPQGLVRMGLSSLLTQRAWDCERLDQASGLQGGAVSHIEFLDGKVWAFGNDHLSIVDDRCHFSSKEVKFYEKAIIVNGVETVMTSHTALGNGENNIGFEFGFISFNNRNIFIRHRPGPGMDWNMIYDRHIHYYSLAPGRYAVEIDYSLDQKNWQRAGMVKEFVIQQAWWKSWWAIAFYLLAITAVIRAIYKQKFRRRLEQIEFAQKLKRERERISRDLHDNIGSRLATISLVFDKVVKENAISGKNSDFVANGLNLAMGDLRDTIWAIEQEKITIPEFSDKVRDLLWRLRQNDIAIDVDFETENLSDHDLITSTQAVNLFRITQEALTNCLKHSKASTIFIKLCKQENGRYYLAIQDNGQGFAEIKAVNGHYGMRNMQSRASEIGAELVLQSEQSLGTTVAVRFNPSK
ncbi:MAG: hypothetical protein JST46_11325 [Bacteroidetes bacterium]|nr:hypothetical protein [Bacteroidota bacterium]